MTDKNAYTPAVSYTDTLLGEKYNKYTHASGLDIYIFPKSLSTSFALFGTKYGSIDNFAEGEDGKDARVPDGVAHFLEHKLFTDEDGSDAFEKFSALGADANAYTAFNRTAYYFISSECFCESLGELVEFVTHPYFTKQTVENEMGIISEEIAMYDDSPSERCLFGMLEGMYHTHSVKNNICGSAESIRRITPEILYSCYEKFYTPNNMVIIVCGDVDERQVLDVIDKHLPYSFRPASLLRANPAEGERERVRSEYVEQKMKVSKPLFCIGFKDTDISESAEMRQTKDAQMAIVNEILFSRSGELYSALINDKLITPAFSYGYTMSKTFAYNMISGEADNPRAVLDRINSYIDKIKTCGLDADEFERAKRVLYSESVKIFDSVESIGNAMFSTICDEGELFSQVSRLGEVTLEDAQKAFYEFFSDCNITLSVISPL